MPKDLTVILQNKPGTLADAAEALGRAGVNIEGGCGFPAGGEGVLHVLVEDASTARRALEEAGLEVRAEREVVLLDRLPDQPGTLGSALRRIADQGVNVDLLYLTTDGRAVLSGGDVEALQRAAGGSA
ncbi:MAG: amino acid-binding protein [Chloroflexota bacterium]|nr:amino acid-binding protein [Chloroflexota bacterium]